MPIISFRGEHAFLSNFYPSRIRGQFATYETAEHAYQSCKTEDWDWRTKIIAAPTPGKAKIIARQAPLREDWNEIREQVMLQVLQQKFKDAGLMQKLLSTGDKFLMEGNNWHDNFWGHCTCGECPPGKNKLGILLMQVRKEVGGS